MADSLLRKYDCVRLYVSNLEEALAFYRDSLGQTLLWRTEHAAGLRLPDTDAELVLQTEDMGQEVDFLVNSVDAAAEHWVRGGGRVMVPPFDVRIGRCAVVKDPWGNVLVLLDLSRGPLQTDDAGIVLEPQCD